MATFILTPKNFTVIFGGVTATMSTENLDTNAIEKFFLSKPEETEENIQKLLSLINPVIKEKTEKNNIIKEVLSYEMEDFYLKDNQLFLEGVNTPIPLNLATAIQDAHKEDKEHFLALKNFWCWAVQNPDIESREDAFKWVTKAQVPILPSGLILTFRRVVKVNNQNTELLEFISENFLKLRKQKKSTDVIVDFRGKSYNLKKEYYNIISSENRPYFTDDRTKKQKYFIGVENRMPREAVCSDRNACSSHGFHVAGPEFAYNGFGDTPVACVVNPKDIIVVFDNDYNKTRVCAFTIVGVLKEDCEWKDDKEMAKTIDEVFQFQQAKLADIVNAIEDPSYQKEGNEVYSFQVNDSVDPSFVSPSLIKYLV